MEYSKEVFKKYREMSDEELFDFTVIYRCPYSWNLGDWISTEVEEWILDQLERMEKEES